MTLKREDSSEKDWEVFKRFFNEIHNDFDHKLRSAYSDISDKDLRLASFIKMNLSTKEIAAILNVMPDSVLKSKYRMKKKLNVEADKDLYQFLQEL